jgi:UDP-glucose 4-epimerase
MVTGKKILITGGTGSLGKMLVRCLLQGTYGVPEKIIVFSRDESKHYAMKQFFTNSGPTSDVLLYNNYSGKLEFLIGDIRSYESVANALRDVDIVIHAAALKQVPTCEYFPYQAVQTNCTGAYNIVRAIRELSLPVKTVVGVGTDKACKPVNLMGMSKAIQEKIFIAANIECPNTSFNCVRYGNVIGTRGSVIPLFLQQVENNQPITVTDPEMTRFLMTLNEACNLIFHAISDASRGSIYVPCSPSAKVGDIANLFAELSSVSVESMGGRPGEKQHEIFISEEELHRVVKSGEYYRIDPALPELQNEDPPSGIPILKEELSSKDYLINSQELKKILSENDLLPKQ